MFTEPLELKVFTITEDSDNRTVILKGWFNENPATNFNSDITVTVQERIKGRHGDKVGLRIIAVGDKVQAVMIRPPMILGNAKNTDTDGPYMGPHPNTRH